MPWTPEDGPKTPLSIFKNSHKKEEKHPDFQGDFQMTDTILKHLAALRSAGKPAVMGFAGWTKKTQGGQTFISGSIRVDVYKTAKRYEVEANIIQKIMDEAVGGDAPAGAAVSAGGGDVDEGDLFDGAAPAEDDNKEDDGLGF